MAILINIILLNLMTFNKNNRMMQMQAFISNKAGFLPVTQALIAADYSLKTCMSIDSMQLP